MFIVTFAAALAAALCFAPAAAHAQGGPFRVDDAAVGDPGRSQIETIAAFSLGRARERLFSARLGHTLAVFPALQLSLGVERDGAARGDESDLGKRRFWGTTLAPEAKLRLLNVEEHGRLGLAVKGGLGWRSSLQRGRGEDGEEGAPFRRLDSAFGLGIATLRLAETVSVNLNGGVERDRAALQGGLRQTVFAERVDLDLVLGRNLSDERASWLVVGLTARF